MILRIFFYPFFQLVTVKPTEAPSENAPQTKSSSAIATTPKQTEANLSPDSFGPDWLQKGANILGYIFAFCFFCALLCHFVSWVLSKCWPGRYPKAEEYCIRASIFCLGLSSYVQNVGHRLHEIQTQREPLVSESQADGGETVALMP